MTQGKPQLTLYSRNYCHLCHDMQAALEAMCASSGEFPDGFELAVVDVDDDPQLVARYDELVPVLVTGSGSGDDSIELCHYHLDITAVRAYLRKFR